jgi:hypothetical protein
MSGIKKKRIGADKINQTIKKRSIPPKKTSPKSPKDNRKL